MPLGLLGRDRELAALTDAMDRPGVVAVVGTAGVGKSSLVRAALPGRSHRLGAALSLLRQRPYVPLESAMRVRLSGTPDEVAEEVVGRCDGLLVVEDLHWAHELTVEVLAHLAEAVPVVVTARPELGAAAAALVEASVRIDLGPLGAATAERLARRLHPGLDDEGRGQLLRLAAGNPLLLERLAEDGGAVSATLRDAMAERLRDLPPARRRALGALALLGRPAPPALVGLDARDRPDLVVADGDELAFGHAALASGVADLLGPDERHDIHAELADRLDDAEAAGHELAAGRPGRAAARAEAAAAGIANAVERAELLQLASGATEAAGGDASTLRARAAAAFVDGGRWRAAVAEAAQVAASDGVVASDAALAEGRARWCMGEVDEARRLFDRAAALAAADDLHRQARIAVERAGLEVRDRRTGCVDIAAEAVRIAERSGTEVLRARGTLGVALLFEGRDGWEQKLRGVMSDAALAGETDAEAAAAYHLVSALGFHGRFAEAVALGREQVERTTRAGLGRWTTHFQHAALMHRSVSGTDHAALLADADRALAGHRLFRNRFQAHLAKLMALLELGRLDEASAAADALDAERGGSAEAAVVLGAMWAELAWHRDDLDLARESLALGRSVLDAYFGLHLLTERTAAHVLLGHGQPVEPVLPTTAMPAWWPALIELDGLRLLADGDVRAGVAGLGQAAEQWRAMQVARWAVRAGTAAVEAQPRPGIRPSPRAAWIDLARSAGLAGTLRRLGVPVHPALTLTEEAVLRHVAAGATSREVAEAMGIAPGTVDQHVESARRKLGAATRLEAAMAVGP